MPSLAVPSYQTLDTIADAYVPLLAIIAFVSIAARLAQPRLALKEFCSFLLLALMAYGLMFTDAAHHLWAKKGWDYSTHTATAAACCWYLFGLSRGRKILGGVFHLTAVYVIWPVSLVGYLLLMRYQGYHSWPDMFTTLVALIPLFTIHFFATR